MSYILNALRKSEQERQDSHIETLENSLQDKHDVAPKKTSFWLIILVLVNLFFLSYFIWSFSKDKNELDKMKIAVHEQKQTIKAKPDNTELELKIENKVIATRPPAVKRPNIEPPKTRLQQSIAEQIKNQRAKNKPTVNTPKIRKKQRPEVKEQEIIPTIQVQPFIKPENKIVPEITVSEKQDTDFPFLSELDYDFRRKVPNIDINVYVYAEKKQDRFIMIAMKKYQSGQQIDSDMTLKEIRMNSLVIEYKNKVFQIKRK